MVPIRFALSVGSTIPWATKLASAEEVERPWASQYVVIQRMIEKGGKIAREFTEIIPEVDRFWRPK